MAEVTVTLKDLAAISNPPADEPLKKKIIPLNGKLVLSDNPAEIGNNFSILRNMRYRDTHPQAVGGMTKINSTPIASNKKADSFFHFTKPPWPVLTADLQAAESHLLAHIVDSASSYLKDNTTAIPNAGEFDVTALLTDSQVCADTYMSNAPLSQMVYCNGIDNYIWGGREIFASTLITSSAAFSSVPANPKDYQSRILNTLTDAGNVVLLSDSGGIDSYVKLLLSCDGSNGSSTFTDSSVSAASVTASGAVLSTSRYVFGSASGYFDGSNDYLSVPASTNWNFSGDFCIDFRLYLNALNGTIVKSVNSDTWSSAGTSDWVLFVDNSGYLNFYIKNVGTFTDTTTALAIGAWHHIAVSRSGSTIKFFVDGVAIYTSTSASGTAGNSQILKIGSAETGLAGYLSAYIDEFRISNGVPKWTGDFTVPSHAYISDTSNNWLVGSPRPLQGVKYYVSRANTMAGVFSGKEWTGSAFTDLTITDGTAVSGVPLAQTGTVSFPSTVNTSKARFLCGYYLYWYYFTLSAGEAEIYFITLDAPIQPLVDLWDGSMRSVAGCYYSDNGTFADNLSNVYEDDYDTNDETSYMAIASMVYTEDALYIGFAERTTAIDFLLPSDGKVNSIASVATIHYCVGGTNFIPLNSIQDTTSVSGATFAKSGTISWTAPSATLEMKTDLGMDITPMYWYKITFSASVSSTTRINYITGVPAQRVIKKYKFPLMALDSLFLCCEVNGKKNTLIHSELGKAQVFNGTYIYEIDFGDDKELMGGCVVYSQFGSAIYNLIMIFKANETWALIKNSDLSWTRYIIDPGVGLAAPDTLKTITLPLETATGINRNLAIWQSAYGIYVSDGRSPVPIHNDIKYLFDSRNSSVYINPTYIGQSSGWPDPANLEYHWCFASNASTDGTLDKEFVFDFKHWKWFEIDRGTGKRLQIGILAKDVYENNYCFGIDPSGYVQRLEYGTDFDGNDIVCQMQLGAAPLEQDITTETQVSKIVMAMVAKSTTTNNVAGTHYTDGGATGIPYSFDPTSPNGRSFVTRVSEPTTGYEEIPGVFHSFHFSMTSDDETIGFEPLHLAILYQEARPLTVSKA